MTDEVHNRAHAAREILSASTFSVDFVGRLGIDWSTGRVAGGRALDRLARRRGEQADGADD